MTAEQVPRLIEVPSNGHPQIGYLSFAENAPDFPFRIQRVYWSYGVPPNQTRGLHAHRELQQLIFAVAGHINITLENLRGQILRFDLKRPNAGLYVPPVHWRELTFSRGAVMMCLASECYDEAEYIRDYQEFKAMGKS